MQERVGHLIIKEIRYYRLFSNHKQWYQHIKRLVDNPNLVTDLGERLFESVQKYHIKKVTEDRAELYKQIIKSH